MTQESLEETVEQTATEEASANGHHPVIQYAIDALALLAVDDLQREDVHVPEWGVTVIMRGLTGTERDAFEATITTTRGTNVEVNFRNIRAKLIAMSAIKPDGERLFTDAQIGALGGKSAAALERLFSVARRLSGLTNQDVVELAGNSDAGPND